MRAQRSASARGRKSVAEKPRASSPPRVNWNIVLLEQIRLAGLPEPIREYVFHANRNWRFDFCWRGDGLLVACEIEGGICMQTDPGPSKGHPHP